jgi:mRNA interferase RelE/StbE
VGSYSLRIKATAAREIERIEPRKFRRAAVDRIPALAGDPRPPGSERLAGAKNQYRVRQGIRRLVYEIRDDGLIVVVVKVDHRRDVHKRL